MKMQKIGKYKLKMPSGAVYTYKSQEERDKHEKAVSGFVGSLIEAMDGGAGALADSIVSIFPDRRGK